MADEDRGNDGPSLELPSLRLGRGRRKAGRRAAPEPAREPQPAPEPRSGTEDAPTAVTPPVPSEPEPAAETRPLFVDEATRAPLSPEASAAPVAPEAPEAEPRQGRVRRRARRERSLPAIGGMAAATITGVLVGVITVGLTWGSQHLCEVVRGTSSCGGPGFLLLLTIMVAMVLLGAALLRAWGLPDPGSTSFLAVGLLAVIALLFLVDVLFNWWMIIVIPICAVATFTLAHWVTATFIEPADR